MEVITSYCENPFLKKLTDSYEKIEVDKSHTNLQQFAALKHDDVLEHKKCDVISCTSGHASKKYLITIG